MPGPELEDVYDDATVARLRRRVVRAGADHGETRAAGWRRGATAGAMVTALALGLRDVFAPESDEPVTFEIDLDGASPPDQPVTVVLVNGAPRASRVVVRPWLLPA
ncbi:MAG: hypothetical protein ACRD29_13030 [Acidimicrobiales bacterium]